MDWIPIAFAVFKGTILIIGMIYAIKWHYEQDKKEKDESGEQQSPTEMRLFAAMMIALAVSLIGIVYAGFWGNTANGGRGGALGCILTFFMCIMVRPKAEATLADRIPAEQDLTTLSEALDQLAKLKVQTEQAQAAFVARLESAQREKIYLCVAGLVSAISWKFGDIAATFLNGGY